MKFHINLAVAVAIIVIWPLLFVSCTSHGDSADKTAEGTLWTCSMHPQIILDHPGQCPICGMNLVPLKKPEAEKQGVGMAEAKKPEGQRKILYWQAPMNPQEIYDHPGKSAMGMDLVPVYEDQVSAGGTVRIDPLTEQNMGVRTAPVVRSDFKRSIRTVGKLEYDEEKIFVVSAKISGWIDKLYVDYTGKPVRRGQPLLEIYSPDLVTTQQEYLLALKNDQVAGESQFTEIREGARSLLNSTYQRLRYWDIPQAEIDRLKQSGEVRKTLALEAPANGVVIQKNAVEGLHVMAGMSLYQIADLSTIWVYASVYDNELPWVKVGQMATMKLSYLPEKVLEGKVVYIYPYLAEKARDIRVRLEFKNPGLDLKPGMYANVWIQAPAIKNAIVIPEEAVIRSGQRNVVFVERGEGRFEPREVRIGEESDDGRIRILAGLAENEKVVISAQFMIDSESRLQEAIQKMLQEKTKGGAAGMDMKEGGMQDSSVKMKMKNEN